MTRQSGALFSPCRTYRYLLWRTLPGVAVPAARKVVFIMLNPSTADEVKNDPTVERCWRRTQAWGYEHMEVLNIFALRSTDPSALYKSADPVGPLNDWYISTAANNAALIICGWGEHGALGGRGLRVQQLLARQHNNACALKVNKSGAPAHPLYLPYSAQPIPLYGPSSTAPSRDAG